MTAYPVERDVWTALFAHAALSYVLLAAPLVVAVSTAGPREPLFGGPLALVAPLYYLVAAGIAVTPALWSAWGTGSVPESENGPVADLKRRYVADDLTETELEERLERELDE